MYTSTRDVEDYSSSELSECESQSTQSDVSAPPYTPEKSRLLRKTLQNAQSRLSRRKLRDHAARRESARLRKVASRNYAESSSSETESIRPKATRGKNKGELSRKNSTNHKHDLAKRYYTKRAAKQEVLRPSPYIVQDTFSQRDFSIQQRQLLDSKKSYKYSGTNIFQEELHTPQIDKCGQQRQLLQQENPVACDVKGIDPSLLKLIFKGAEALDWTHLLPPDPILLGIGKPIWIPIWEIRDFQPCDISHEEPSNLALADYEGETNVVTTSQRRSRTEKQGTKYSFERREKRPYRKTQKSTVDSNPPYRIVKTHEGGAKPASTTISKPIRTLPPIPEAPSRIPYPAFTHPSQSQTTKSTTAAAAATSTPNTSSNNLQRSRFLLLMHLYWEQTPTSGLTASLNRECEGEEGAPWTVTEVEQMLAQAMVDPRLEAYRRRWEDAKVFEGWMVDLDGEGGQ